MGLRLLVVEDEENIALALSQMLLRAFECVAVDVAYDGEQALAELGKQEYDLIISDWNMPNKSGDELLIDVRSTAETNTIPFLMLTARSDRQSVIVALQGGVTEYITKPFDKRSLLEKVKEMLGDKAILRLRKSDQIAAATAEPSAESLVDVIDTIHRLVKRGEITLPQLPEVAFDLTQLLQNEYVTADEVVETVSRDPVISSHLLRVANSAYCGAGSSYSTIDAAVKRLGFKQTETIVLMNSTQGLVKLDAPSLERRLATIWDHSQLTALIAKQLAHTLLPKQQDALFTMGLLHDIGKVVSLEIIHSRFTSFAEEQLDEALAALHTQVGAALMRSWKLSMEMVDVVLHHHDADHNLEFSPSVLLTAFSNRWAHHLVEQQNDPQSDESWQSLQRQYGLDLSAINEEHFNREVLQQYQALSSVN